jgi:(S)-mandelate dehydrogenase
MSKSLSWDTIAKIRDAWAKPLILKGILNLDDVGRGGGAGGDGIGGSSHGGRQLDWTVAGLDLLPEARRIAGDKLTIMVSGGIRRGTDVLKAMALGADAVMVGRAPLYGVAAAGETGVARALDILRTEMDRSLGLLGANRLSELDCAFLRHIPSGAYLPTPDLPT